jgi:hypothetical protein
MKKMAAKLPNDSSGLILNNMQYQYFIASRFRNKEAVLDLTVKLQRKSKSVYCFVQEYDDSESPEEYMQKFENISHWQESEVVKEMFDKDMNALKNSETLILLLPAGKSAHIEAGAAYGMGKKCIVIGEQKETESLYLIFNEFYKTIDEFVKSLD